MKQIGARRQPCEFAGGWLCRLVQFSAQQTTEYGAMSFAAVAVDGNAFHYMVVGDCAVHIFAYNHVLHSWSRLFRATSRMMEFVEEDGEISQGPQQVIIHEPSDRCSSSLVTMLSAGEYSARIADENELVVAGPGHLFDRVEQSRIVDLISSVCPHGVAWASDAQTRESARTIGTALVEEALRSEGLKPEHVRVHVGFIMPTDL